MEEKYINYYNGEDANFSFIFEGVTKEEALRVQAYMLQDSHFIIQDENALEKLSEEQVEITREKNFTKGNISISKDSHDKGRLIITGSSKTTDFQGDVTGLVYRGNIYSGLNFIAITGIVEDEQTRMCKFSEVNWCYEKSVDPTRLTRHNIKNNPNGSKEDKLDLEGEDIIYMVNEGFKITDNPTEVFKTAIRKLRVKRK